MRMHAPDSSSPSRGIQRMVAFVSCLMRSSVSDEPSQWASTNPPASSAALNSSHVSTRVVVSFVRLAARSNRAVWISSSNPARAHDACSFHNFLGLGVAARHFDGSSGEVAGAHGQTHRHPFQFVLGELPTAALRVVVVDLHAYTGCLQFIGDAVERSDDFRHLVFALVNGYKYDFDGANFGENESCIVRVRHDQGAHQRVDTPTRWPNQFLLAVARRELHIKCAGEVLAEEVRGPACNALPSCIIASMQ